MSILRADSIRDRAGTGAPDFPNGLTGNLTGTATTATALSGTPSITVQDATVQGNLTVNGTTTTIDTVITEVDSLNVEGNVGIGTTVVQENVNYNTLQINGRSGTGGGIIRLKTADATTAKTMLFCDTGGFEARVETNHKFVISTNDTERVQITPGGTAIFKAGLAEKFNNVGTTLAATTNHAITNGNVILFTGNEPSAARTLGITGVHSVLAVGESFSVTAIISPNGTGTVGGITIDNVGQTIQWSGGSAPSAGASGRDVYTFTFLKTGSGTTDYQVFGAATNYA